jgi:hypothetical protein
MSRDIAEFAYDLHAGLSAHQVREFDDLHRIGMAATLAIHVTAHLRNNSLCAVRPLLAAFQIIDSQNTA